MSPVIFGSAILAPFDQKKTSWKQLFAEDVEPLFCGVSRRISLYGNGRQIGSHTGPRPMETLVAQVQDFCVWKLAYKNIAVPSNHGL